MTNQGGNKDKEKDQGKEIQLDTLQDSTTININGNDSNNTSPNKNNNSLHLFGVEENAYESDSDYSDTEETPQTPAAKANPFANEIWTYTARSLGVFGYGNPFRKTIFSIVFHPAFEWLIFILILITAVFNILAANYDASESLIKANDHVSLAILILFTIEAAMRVVSIGLFFDKKTYLRDPWNIFDMIVIVAGWIDVGTPDFGAVYVLRLLRVMRFVRIIRMVPTMRELVRGIVRSIPTLAHTGALFLIIFFVFAIVGLKLFNGAFRGRCFSAAGEIVDDERVCSTNSLYGYHCNKTEGEICQDYENPNYGFTNFDNFAWSMLTVFQILTVEGWTDDLYFSQDGSIRALTWIYFILVVLVGSFFVLNLVTAVLCDNIGATVSVTIPHLFSQKDLNAVVAGDENNTSTPGAPDNNNNNNNNTNNTDDNNNNNKDDNNNNNNKDKDDDDKDKDEKTLDSPSSLSTRQSRSTFLRPEQSVRFVISPSPSKSRRNSKNISVSSGNNTMEKVSSSLSSSPSTPHSRRPTFSSSSPSSPSSSSAPPIIVFPDAGESPSIQVSLLEDDKMKEEEKKISALKDDSENEKGKDKGEGAEGKDKDKDGTKTKRRKKKDGTSNPSSPTQTQQTPQQQQQQQQQQPNPQDPQSAELLASMFSNVFADVYSNYFPENFKDRLNYFDRVIRPRVNRVLFDFKFEVYVCIVVLAHSIVLATQHFGMTEGHKKAVFIIDRIFIALFTLEVLLRMVAAGIKGYFQQTKVNWLDMVVLIGCWVEIGLELSGILREGIYISIFRLFRVFELLRQSQVFNNSAESIIACFKITANPFLLLIVFMYVYSMIGVSIFGNPDNFMDDDGHPRQNFDSFLEAALCVFQVLTGENWNNLLYTGMLHTYGSVPFFVSMYVLGRYVLLAFFLAVMVDVYAETNPVILQRKLYGILNKYKNQKLSRNFHKFVQKFKGQDAAQPSDSSGSSFMTSVSSLPLKLTGSMSGFFERRSEHSYWIFAPDTVLRERIDFFMTHKYYQTFSMVVVVLSCVTAALYLPHSTSSSYNKILQRIEIFFAVFFLVEMFLKGLAKNFVFGKTKYLHDIWSAIDFVVIVVSSITTFVTRYKFFIVFRAFRPLQLITVYKPVRIVLQALIYSLPSILPVFIISLLWWSMFSVLGVQLWSGSFKYCQQDETLPEELCVGEYINTETNETTQYRWDNPTFSFDNYGWGMLTLFEISTLEGWLDVMYAACDATVPGQPPSRGYQPAGALFFVFFIVGAVFFLLNLFVAVVTNQFFIVYEKESGLAFMDEKEREWKETKRLLKGAMAIVKPKPPERPRFMRKIHYIVFHRYFEFAIAFLVCLNMIVFMLEHYGMSNGWSTSISTLILIFSLIYVVELLLTLYFYGIKAFMRSNVRIFEGVVVIVSLIVIIVSHVIKESYFITFLTIFLILRVFRLVKLSRKIRILIATLWNSLLLNGAVFLVLCILLYIYAVIGIHFYPHIVFGDFLNVHANFNNFPVACLTLFRMLTGENWNGIMHDCMVQEPDCSQAEGTCGTTWAILYFVSFQMIGTFMFLPLFVAVILRQFQDETSAENFTVSPARIEEFKKVWQKFDPYGKQRINIADLYYFLAKLPKPLGLGKHKSVYYNQLIRKLTVKPNIKGQIQFQPLLINLAALAMGIDYKPHRKPTDIVSTVNLVGNKSNKKMDKIAKNFKQESNQMWFLFAVIFIQRLWRARRRRRIFFEQLRNPELFNSAESNIKSSSGIKSIFGGKSKIIKSSSGRTVSPSGSPSLSPSQHPRPQLTSSVSLSSLPPSPPDSPSVLKKPAGSNPLSPVPSSPSLSSSRSPTPAPRSPLSKPAATRSLSSLSSSPLSSIPPPSSPSSSSRAPHPMSPPNLQLDQNTDQNDQNTI